MAYSYTKPPMYDSRLSQHTLKALAYAPVFYAIYAAWLFSNQQVFRNLVPEITNFLLYPLQGHKFEQWFEHVTPGTPFVCYIIGVVLMIIVGLFSRCCCRKDDNQVAVEDLTRIENLGHFFSMLKNKDREFWFREETVMRDRVGLKRVNNKKNFEALVLAEPDKLKRRLRSVHNYDILTNPIYSDRFHYVPGAYPMRHHYIIS